MYNLLYLKFVRVSDHTLRIAHCVLMNTIFLTVCGNYVHYWKADSPQSSVVSQNEWEGVYMCGF